MGSAVHAGAQISMPELNLHAGAQISMPELNLHAGAQSPCRNSNLHTGAQSPCRRSNLHTGAQSTALSESGTDKEVSSVYETPYDCFAFRGQMVSTKAIVANCSSSRKAMSVHAHGKPRRPEDGRNQMQSDAIRCNHMQSDAIRDNQRRPPLPRAPEDGRNQMQSDAIRRNQTQSETASSSSRT